MRLEDTEKLAEDKLLLLYILSKAGMPLSNVQIVRLTMESKLLNYFFIQQFLSELVEKKYVVCYSSEDARLYEITHEGKQVLAYFENLIPASIRYKVDCSIKKNLLEIKNEISVSADCIPKNEEEYDVRCVIKEGTTTLLELTLYAGSKEHARSIASIWEKHAFELYPKIIELLTKG